MKSYWFKIKLFLIKEVAKYFKIILIFSVLLISLIGYNWILKPEFESVEKESDLSHIQAYEKYLEEYLADLYDLRVIKNKLSRDVKEKIVQLLPAEEDIAGLFVQIQLLAQKNDFILESINISQVEKLSEPSRTQGDKNPSTSIEDNIEKIDITIVVSGNDYEHLKNFLNDIENNLRLFDVFSINFGSAEKGPYSIVLNTYYLSQ